MKMLRNFFSWYWEKLKSDREFMVLQFASFIVNPFVGLVRAPSTPYCQLYVVSVIIFLCVRDRVAMRRKTKEYEDGMKHLNFFQQECERVGREWAEAIKGYDSDAIRSAEARFKVCAIRYMKEAEKTFGRQIVQAEFRFKIE